MIKRIFLNLTVLGAIVLALADGTELNSNEAEAEIFLNKTSGKLFGIYEEAEKGKSAFFDDDKQDAAEKEAKSLKKIVEDSRKFDFENFKDQGLLYAFKKLIQVADLKIIKRKQFRDLYHALDEGERRINYHNFYNFDGRKHQLLDISDIKKVFKKSRDPKELQYLWSKLMKTTEKKLEPIVDITTKALKTAADFNKVSSLEFWLRGFNINDMEKLMTDIQPLYFEVHAFIRNQLRKKYGDSIIGTDGLIPDNLLEQVVHQIRTNQSIIEEMFSYDSLPPVESVMKEKFQAKQLYEIAEGSYENLGFEKYPSSIWGDRIKLKKDIYDIDDDDDDDDNDDDEEKEKEEEEEEEKEEEEEEEEEEENLKKGDKEDEHAKHDNDDNVHADDEDTKEDNDEYEEDEEEYEDDDDDDNECHPVVHYSTPNILLEYCEKLKFRDFLHAYAIMGHLHYANEMVGLPAYFFKPPQGLEHAIGKAMVLSASTHHNLKAVGMIPPDFKITPEVEMNRLLRMAITRLIKIPMDFVQIKVMADLVSGNVKKAEIHNHYWNLMDKYAGVGPSKVNESSSLYIPFNFYQRLTHNDMSRDFTTKILGHQIHKKLCELSGKYPKEELHLCDINGSKEAGNALRKMMHLGSSKPFNEVLATMFPENPTVRVEGLLEYYNPIKKLLMEKNKEANVSPGWKNSSSKKS